ncbi:MAG: hypothetical protein COA47_12605 [Robiginitomaculum sp.]|nr:MAG: hypothetical protein COA47_12605 [Robiginitomaculum sp.]
MAEHDIQQNDGTDPVEMPLISAHDAADYLSEILPQLAEIALNSGLAELGELMVLASSFAINAKTEGKF